MRSAALVSLLAIVGTAVAQHTPSLPDLLKVANLNELATAAGAYPDILELLTAKDAQNTIFAPTDEAFAAAKAMLGDALTPDVLKQVLTYHVSKGVVKSTDLSATPAFVKTLLPEGPFRNISGEAQVAKAVIEDKKAYVYSGLLTKSEVVKADNVFAGGIAHVVNKVLIPPMAVSTTAKTAGLSSLVDALTTAGLVSTVDQLRKVTIFAPNNAAFAKLTATPSKEDLAKILTYHVVPGAVGYSTTLTDGMKLKTVEGNELTIKIANGVVTVNGAKVVTADVLVNNGVVHVIDTVLVPGSKSTPSGTAPAGGAVKTPAVTGAGHHHCRWSGPAVVGCLIAAGWGMV